MKVAALLVIACLAGGGYARAADQIFHSPEFGFRLIYPSDWKLVRPGTPNVRVSIKSPPGPDFANCNVFIAATPSTEKTTQAELDRGATAPWSEQYWKEQLSDFLDDQLLGIRPVRTSADGYALTAERRRAPVPLDGLSPTPQSVLDDHRERDRTRQPTPAKVISPIAKAPRPAGSGTGVAMKLRPISWPTSLIP